MAQFKHHVSGEIREWRTDNEEIFRRLRALGWSRIEASPPKPVTAYDWTAVRGINLQISDALNFLGINSPEVLLRYGREQLLPIPGIGESRLDSLIAYCEAKR